MGRVVGLHRTPQTKLPPQRLEVAVLRADWGVEGDRHARPGSSRQVVLTQREVLDELRQKAGTIREQLTIDGLGSLRSGDVLCVGPTVRLQLTKPRVPCWVMDTIRPGLRAELEGRGGWCARVLDGGEVRGGDEVTIEGVEGTRDPQWLADYLAAMADWEASPTLLTHDGDGWTTFADRLAHLVAWDQRAAERIAAVAAGADPTSFGPTDLDAFNADAVARLAGADLWDLQDTWSTAVIDAARRWPAAAEPWVRAQTNHYREHTAPS
jgi:MOSC domain-containing protein YiiM